MSGCATIFPLQLLVLTYPPIDGRDRSNIRGRTTLFCAEAQCELYSSSLFIIILIYNIST